MSVARLGVAVGARSLLSEVEFAVSAGQCLSLIGPNGSGKTTILNALCGIVKAHTGCISLDGEDITGLSPHKRARRGLRRLFQSPQLFPEFTVREALELASRDWSRRRPEPSAAAPPEGGDAMPAIASELDIEALMPVRIASLSVGQRRLVGIAMTLAAPARALLFDEPATGLSPAAAGKVAERLAAVPAAMIVVEHNFDMVRFLGGRTAVLSEGRVVIVGETQDVLASQELRAAYR